MEKCGGAPEIDGRHRGANDDVDGADEWSVAPVPPFSFICISFICIITRGPAME